MVEFDDNLKYYSCIDVSFLLGNRKIVFNWVVANDSPLKAMSLFNITFHYQSQILRVIRLGEFKDYYLRKFVVSVFITNTIIIIDIASR